MDERQILTEKIEKAVSYARRHKNTITEDNFVSIMGDLACDEKRRTLIEAYLKEKHIRVLTADAEAEQEIDFDLNLDDGDRKALDFYFEDLKALPHLTDREKERITNKAVRGDADAQQKLINIYLPQVVDLAKLYTGHDIPLEDLIGEGNIALMIGVTMLENLETMDELDGYLGKVIIDALEKLVTDEDDEEKLIVKLGQQLKKAAPDEEETLDIASDFRIDLD